MTVATETTTGNKNHPAKREPIKDDDASAIDTDDTTPNGFDEIENAFDRVSNLADALLDSIRDDSLRGKQRIRQTRRKYYTQQSSSSAVSISDDDDNDDDDDFHNNNHKNHNSKIQSTPSKHAHNKRDNPILGGYKISTDDDDDDDDCSSLGDGEESIDGSLVYDMKNLKSASRALQEELAKEGEAFQAANSNAKAFLQQRFEEKASEAETPRIENLKTNKSTAYLLSKQHNNDSMPQYHVPERVLFQAGNRTQNNRPSPPMVPSLNAPKATVQFSFLQQLQNFCIQQFGKHPNLPLLIVNLAIWLVFCRLVYSSKEFLVDSEGKLVPIGSLIGF